MSNWVDEIISAAAPSSAVVIAWAGEVEFLSASETDTTGRTVKLRLARPPEELGQGHPFSKFTRRRKGFAGTRFEASLSPLDGTEALALSTVLLNWQDSPSGSSVSLKLSDDGYPQHPLMFCKRPSAEGPGTRWMAVFVELTDDELPVNQKQADMADKLADTRIANSEDGHPHPYGKGPGQSYAQGVALLIKSGQFLEFLNERIEPGTWTPDEADTWIKAKLGIASKSELNVDGPPRKVWEQIKSAYLEWSGRGQYLRD